MFVKKYKYIVVIISLIALFFSMCEAGKCEKQIENFEGSPFDNIGKIKDSHVVLYHSDGCGWCKKMMPEWKKFKKAHSNDIKIIDVEAGENPHIMEQHNINGFPTIIHYENGNKSIFKGERTLDGFKKHCNLN